MRRFILFFALLAFFFVPCSFPVSARLQHDTFPISRNIIVKGMTSLHPKVNLPSFHTAKGSLLAVLEKNQQRFSRKLLIH